MYWNFQCMGFSLCPPLLTICSAIVQVLEFDKMCPALYKISTDFYNQVSKKSENVCRVANTGNILLKGFVVMLQLCYDYFVHVASTCQACYSRL